MSSGTSGIVSVANVSVVQASRSACHLSQFRESHTLPVLPIILYGDALGPLVYVGVLSVDEYLIHIGSATRKSRMTSSVRRGTLVATGLRGEYVVYRISGG